MFVTLANVTVANKPLFMNTYYCINFVIENIYRDIKHFRIYHKDRIFLKEAIHPIEPMPQVNTSNTSVIVVTVLGIVVFALIVVAAIFYFR